MTHEQYTPGEPSVHPEWASRETRAYATSVLAPLGTEESETAVRRAIETVTADGSVRVERLTIYPPRVRVEKPARRDEAPRRMVWVRVRDIDRRVTHEVAVGDGIVVEHQVDEHATPPFSDDERAEARRLLTEDSRFGKTLADTGVEIEWFSPGHGPDRQLGVRLVRIEETRVAAVIDTAVVDLDNATIIVGGDLGG